MPDKPVRPQINVRLDKIPSLLDDIKQAASDRNTTASQFVIDAILAALNKPTTTTPTDTPSLEAILTEVDKHLDTKLDQRLGEFERRLLKQVRPIDRPIDRPENRQPPPEELIEDRQVFPEIRPDARPDYQAIRDRVLRSLTTGRGSFASTSPQFRAASRALDRFINEIQGDPKAPKSD